jgi:hypothetical protein
VSLPRVPLSLVGPSRVSPPLTESHGRTEVRSSKSLRTALGSLVTKASGAQDAMLLSEKGNGTWKFASSTEAAPVKM